ncbi:hypothetical protein DYB28_011966 [Aphanomyces astaci]|uniref:SAP domain-containing protein n=1 Tax=Aphanomyces astaci TaxID=112090 RepID=A0A9X8E2C0_APHAT|nr:hypothetical protein DYB28_011966 [Aphanomyces astaci]
MNPPLSRRKSHSPSARTLNCITVISSASSSLMPTTRPFRGIYMYKISNRREQEYRAAIRATQETKLKDKARKDERTKRASGRQTKSDDMGSTQGKETLFAINLLDACPRCGDDDVDPTEDSREFLGGKSSDMWLLTATQLQHMAKGYELDATGTREELIGRLVRYRNTLDAKNMLGNGGSSNAVTNKRKRGPVSLEDLPQNLESMGVAQPSASPIPRGRSKALSTPSSKLSWGRKRRCASPACNIALRKRTVVW